MEMITEVIRILERLSGATSSMGLRFLLAESDLRTKIEALSHRLYHGIIGNGMGQGNQFD